MAETKTGSSTRKKRGRSSRRNIIEAAIRLFESRGTAKVSMEDIATEAGISRKTLYRTFEDRSALIEMILQLRFAALSGKTHKKISSYTGVEQALVDGSLYSVSAGRRDKLFQDIVEHETNHRIDQFLLRGNEAIREGMAEIWYPVIARGRQEGLVREDLTNERIVELIISMHAFLQMRDDYGRKEQRAFLEDFLVPAVLNPGQTTRSE